MQLNASDKVEIFASIMDSTGSIVEAKGGVSVIYKDYLITADRAIYDRSSGFLELFDNIRLNYGESYKVLGKYAKLNIAKKERHFEPFYMSDKETQLWISAESAKTKRNDTDISSGVLSGCNPIDPLWKIEFSSSDYNSDSKWMNIYNARLYLDDLAIFYTPYFGYSLDKTRRTGLLMPSLGYSSAEGVYYEQPIYIAEQNWWDLEFRPQSRSQRGYGIYQTFRFVDSPYSHGEFRLGYFKEKEKYVVHNDLQNESHYGFNFLYDNSNVLNQWFGSHLEGQSALYADISSMNDVDYINLETNNPQDTTTATQLLSRINLFYNTNDQYIGSYFKYYQDLTLSSNSETLQVLPTLQYHYYLDTLFNDHMLYNLDVQANNITRTEGKTVVQTDINLPVSLQTSLFDEYLNVSYKANVYMQHSSFGSDEKDITSTTEYNDGYILRNYHTLTASTQLTKGYESFSHVVSASVSYNRTGTESKSGYYEDNQDYCGDSANRNETRCEFYNISSIQDEAELDLIQYIYDDQAKQVLYQRLTQKISYSSLENRYGEIEHELDYKITSYLSFYNNMFYNYEKNKFSKIFNEISFKEYGVNFLLSHLYKDDFLDDTEKVPRHTSYLTSTLRYNYNVHYSFNALYNYDLEAKETKSKEIGFMYKQRCWDFGIRYSENKRPILTSGIDTSSIYDRYLYFTIILKPIMDSSDASLLSYKFKDN